MKTATKAATAKVHLVTIICANELESRLVADLQELGGISGCTVLRANGRGLHGPREYGIVDGANLQFEILVPSPLAKTIFELLAAKYDGDALTAYSQAVEAFPRSHFLP
jgi:hypothetical protein